MRDYLKLLDQQKRAGQDIRIDFSLVPIDRIRAQAPGKSMGLQLADAAAGAVFNALEKDEYGNSEPRYLKTLMPLFYRNRGSILGYGLKIVPRDAPVKLAGQANLVWLAELC